MTKINIDPLEDNVLIELEKPEEVTKHGILIPENSRETTCRGQILAVGPKCTVEVNQTVIISKYYDVAKTIVNVNDKDCVLIRQRDVLAVVRK